MAVIMMIIFYFGSISAKAPVCQPHITKTQQKKKLILKVVFRLNLRLTFFVCILLHYTDIKSEEKVYSKVCIFPLSSHIQEGFFFFFPPATREQAQLVIPYAPIPLSFSICMSLDLNTDFNQCK